MSGLRSYRHIIGAGLLATTLLACSQEVPQYPDQALLLCESAADCPTDWECLPCPDEQQSLGPLGCISDAQYCAPIFDNVCGTTDAPSACCGNGMREAWEFCDDGAENTDAYSTAERCNSACDGYAPYCGDDIVSNDETCDAGPENTDVYGLGAECNTACTGPAPSCGDGIVQAGQDEACDDGNTEREPCAEGTLHCDVCGQACQWVNGIPDGCGDGNLDEGEVCDDGDVFDWRGDCLGDCSGPTRCADGARHFGVCAPAGMPVERPDRFFSVGSYHVCRVGLDASLQCWGRTAFDGPLPSVEMDNVVALASDPGGDSYCAVGLDGSIECSDRYSGGASDNAWVSIGREALCVLSHSGSVSCYGQWRYGASSVEPPDDLGVATDVVVGASHACAVVDDGAVRCWGENIGYGDAVYNQAQPPVGLNNTALLVAGDYHTCALSRVGRIHCWGRDEDDESSPPSGLGQVRAIASADDKSCALYDEDQVACWGDKDYFPNPPRDLRDVVGLSMGNRQACARHRDGAIRCWGPTYSTNVPKREQGSAVAVGVGLQHNCLILDDGSSHCWGDVSTGQSVVPMDLGMVVDIAGGAGHTCALTTAQSVTCWGMTDTNIQRGDFGQADPPDDLGPVQAIDAGWEHSCALMVDGTVRCWGGNEGYLSFGDDAFVGQSEVPPGLRDVTQLALGAFHSCALLEDKTVRCWGEDGDGESTPPEDLGPVKQVAAGFGLTCAVQEDETVRCWGALEETGAEPPDDLLAVSQIAVGMVTICALELSGIIRCWGDYLSESLGLTRFVSNESILDFGLGMTHGCALLKNGTVECFGQDPNQLGQNQVPWQFGDARPQRGGYKGAPCGERGNVDGQFVTICPEPDERFLIRNRINESQQLELVSGCFTPECGNGWVDVGEVCDDGDSEASGWCNADCTVETAVCGDGHVSPTELCDDGLYNRDSWESWRGCSGSCQGYAPHCGDALLQGDEICDHGTSTFGCDIDCTLPVCGDGVVNPAFGEQCDDGNSELNDGCENCLSASQSSSSGDLSDASDVFDPGDPGESSGESGGSGSGGSDTETETGTETGTDSGGEAPLDCGCDDCTCVSGGGTCVEPTLLGILFESGSFGRSASVTSFDGGYFAVTVAGSSSQNASAPLTLRFTLERPSQSDQDFTMWLFGNDCSDYSDLVNNQDEEPVVHTLTKTYPSPGASASLEVDIMILRPFFDDHPERPFTLTVERL